jgi:flagellar protein FliO/FliZ
MSKVDFKMLYFLLSAITSETTPTEMMPSYEGAFLKMFLTLLALVIGIFLMIWVLKRMAQGGFGKGGGSGRSIKVVERQPLSAKTMLYVIEVAGKQTLIAESQLEIKTITSIEEMEKN